MPDPISNRPIPAVLPRPVTDVGTPATTTSTTTTSTTSTTTPATTTIPTGLDAATGAHVAPSSGGAVLGGLSSGLGGAGALAALTARGFSAGGPSTFALVDGRVPNAVGLDVVMKQLGRTPEGQAAVKTIIAGFERESGIQVPPALVAAAMANPERLPDVLTASPKEMSAGIDALNKAHREGKIEKTADKQRILPKTFDLAKLDAIAFERPAGDVKELAPGLLRGDMKNEALSDAQAKKNAVMAEVFDRLAENATLKPSERFAVQYRGGTYTRVDTFVDALRKDGVEVTARIEHRVANFAGLLTRAPDGSLMDVPAPLMVRADVDGKAAVLPSIHSEVVFSLAPGPDTKGPAFASEVKWYQGVPQTGFFPVGLMRTPEWCGGTTSDTFTGDDAVRAMELAALFSDVVNDASKAAGLHMNGYGVTGVCNDSVAIVQQALTGRVTMFPLLMRDEMVLPELEKRVSAPGTRDDGALRALIASVRAVPSDTTTNDTQHARALSSIPWAKGSEPFASTETARALLEDVVVEE